MATPQEGLQCQLTWIRGSSQRLSDHPKSMHRLVQGQEHIYHRGLPHLASAGEDVSNHAERGCHIKSEAEGGIKNMRGDGEQHFRC